MDLTAIDYLGLDRVLRRGTGAILETHNQAILIHDSVSDALLLGCTDAESGADILERHLDENCRLLMISDHSLGLAVFKQYGFTGLLECYQTAYYGPSPVLSGSLTFRDAEAADLPLLIATYDLVSADELKRIVAREKLMFGYDQGKLIGFIGEHLEGSMGLLYVFPEYRRLGYAEELEKAMIEKTLEEGFTPFGQVEKNNDASLMLQKKIGMMISNNLICWMWR